MGRAHVERDGVSVSHAARFLLVGTMNPEEGELRPQLLDRFGLAVEVRAARDVATRAEVVRRRLAFEDDPSGFAAALGVRRTRDGRRASPTRRPASAPWRCPTPSCAASPRCAPRSTSTACAPTSSSPAPPPRTPPGGGRTRSRRRTCGSRPGSRCRTGAAATRSTRRASTSRPSTTPWSGRARRPRPTRTTPTAGTRRRRPTRTSRRRRAARRRPGRRPDDEPGRRPDSRTATGPPRRTRRRPAAETTARRP